MTKDYGYWSSASLNRAELYELTGQFGKAIIDYKNLIEDHGYRAKVSVLLKMIPVYLKMARYNQAMEASTQVLREHSQQWEQVEAYTYRAVAYYYLNEFDKSWADIAKIKEWGKEFLNILKMPAF